ncbi:archease, partial [Patescibacteria group bacterium]|nr:archease [Patescibacteria group bacterium]
MVSESFEILPHTADLAVRARGDDKAELIKAAVQGMFAGAEPRYVEKGKKTKRSFALSSSD